MLELNAHDHDKPPILDVEDISHGMSLVAHKVRRDNTISTVKWQYSNIFQFKCKIKDKVCKLIIDSSSFTDAISSDLVHSLFLSMRMLPTPCSMQWMNQSGTLKIAHKVRVKFSVWKYVNLVDCDVAPVSACHLLLGHSCQFDMDATHGGLSNNYSFVHKGLPYVLKPIKTSTIKAESFPILSKKKHVPTLNPKSMTALLQGKENDMSISDLTIVVSISNDDITSAIDGSKIVFVNSISNIGKQEDMNYGECRIVEGKDRLKARMNLFKEWEDNMTNISPLTTVAENSINPIHIQFGTLDFELKIEDENNMVLIAPCPIKI
jgi:hypothetical protein